MKTGLSIIKIGFYMFLAGIPAWYLISPLFGDLLMMGCPVLGTIGAVMVLLKGAEEKDEENRKLFK